MASSPSTYRIAGLDPLFAPDADRLNRLTHALGTALAVPAGCLLVAKAALTGDPWRVAGCAVYAAALAGVFAASTLSHAFPHDRPRRKYWRAVDQAAIFALIAGSATPFVVAHHRDRLGAAVMIVMWALAAVGIRRRLRAAGGDVGVPDAAFSGAMAWVTAALLPRAYTVGGAEAVALGLGGLGFYGLGSVFLLNDHREGLSWMHAVWHLCTLAGCACHFWFNWTLAA